MNPTPTPLSAQVQEWRKQAQRLITIFGHAAAQGEAALAEEAALLAHLSAVPFNQVVQEPPSDPMDWPLPCDVTVGHGTMRKGVKLGTLVLRMKALYEMATGKNADEVAGRSLEERVLHGVEAISLEGGGVALKPTSLALAASPQPVPVQEPVAFRVRELYAQGPGRWDYYEWGCSAPMPKEGEELQALYAAQPGEALPAEQLKSDKSYPVVAVGEINKTALPEDALTVAWRYRIQGADGWVLSQKPPLTSGVFDVQPLVVGQHRNFKTTDELLADARKFCKERP